MPEDSYSDHSLLLQPHTLMTVPTGRGRSASWKSRATETSLPQLLLLSTMGPSIHRRKIHLPGMQTSQREEALERGFLGEPTGSSPMEGTGPK